MALKRNKLVRKVHQFLDDIHIPMLGISLWKMFQIYGQGIFRSKVIDLSRSISWSFFLSIFPFLLFLFTILPYFPHYNELQYYIFHVLVQRIFPGNIESNFLLYIQQNISPKTELGGFTLLFVLIFATTGTHALIEGFNMNVRGKRHFLKEYFISAIITLGFTSLIVLYIFGIYYAEVVIKFFRIGTHHPWLIQNLSQIINYVSFPLFYFILLGLFYWAGCVKITKFRQAIPGAILTTFLFVFTTYFFAIYVKSFALHNLLYGSIGSVILVMIWIHINVVLILFGNELNLAIRGVRAEKINTDRIRSLKANENLVH